MTIQAQLADGRVLEFPDGTDPAVVQATVKRLIAESTPAPKEGIMAALAGGAKRFGSTLETAAESVIDPNLAAQRGVARSQALGQEYAPAASLDRVKQAYAEKGLFPAAYEAISQAPKAFAENVPNMASILASGRLGAMAGSALGPVGTGVGALIGGGVGAFAPSAIQAYGSNLERQAQEGSKDVSRTAALGAAVPAAALEVASTYIPLGRTFIGKLLGPSAEKALARGSSQGIETAAKESVMATLAKGTAIGAGAEIPTEVTQQMLERLQAGLPLTTPDALKEYGEAAYGAALVGGPIGAVARAAGRPGAREEYQALKQKEEQAVFDAERKAKLDKFAAEESEAQKQRDVTREQLGADTSKMLALPAPDKEVKPVDETRELVNPVGDITRNELAPEVTKYIDTYRKDNGLPRLKTFSVEDVKDAMTQVNPKGERAALDSILTAKTGYTGEQKYTAENVLDAAVEKNVATETKGFNDFLARVTGVNDLNGMTQPQLFAAFKALKDMKREDTTQQLVLPEGSNASRYTQRQYDQALDYVRSSFEESGNKPLSTDTILTDIKDSTKLETERDAMALLDAAIKNEDLSQSREVVFRTYREGQERPVATYRDKAKAQAAAKKQGLNVKEEALVQVAPAEAKVAPETKRAPLPTGYDIKESLLDSGTAPAEFAITPEGRGKRLTAVPTEGEATAKIPKLQALRAQRAAQMDANIAKSEGQIAKGQAQLDRLEADGKGDSEQYKVLQAKQASRVKTMNSRIELFKRQKEEFLAPLQAKPAGQKTLTRQAFTVSKDGKSVGSFPSRQAAEESILTNLPDEELAKVASDTRFGGITDRAVREQERRKEGKTGIEVKGTAEGLEKAGVQTPALKEKLKTLEDKLVPLLSKFGLKDVALNVVKSIERNAEGSYIDKLIKIAMDAENPIRTMRHEALHAMKELGFFTDAQWKALEKQAKDVWIDKYLGGQMAKVGDKVMTRLEAYKQMGLSEAEIIEEAIADAFGDFDTAGKAPPGMLQALFKRMQQFFGALRQALGGAGFESAEEIFGKIERGELKTGKETGGTETKLSLPAEEKPKEKIDPNDVSRVVIDGPYADSAIRTMNSQITQTSKPLEVDDVGRLFDKAFLDEFKSKGDWKNPADFQRAVNQAITELKHQLQQTNSGLDWYEEDIAEAFKQTQKYIPSLKKPEKRALFSVIAGIMSPSVNARDNWVIAAQAYQYYEKTGILPGSNPATGSLWQGGLESANKKKQLDMLNAMLQPKSKGGLGEKGAVEWLQGDHTVAEITNFRKKYGGMGKSSAGGKASDILPGFTAFGPKVGPFVMNINGIHDVTVDVWMTRTFNRYFGQMMGADGTMTRAPTEPQRVAIKKLAMDAAAQVGIKPYQVQSTLWFFEQQLFNKLGTGAKSYGFSDGAIKFIETQGGTAPAKGAPANVGANAPANKPTGKQAVGNSAQAAKPATGKQGVSGEQKYSIPIGKFTLRPSGKSNQSISRGRGDTFGFVGPAGLGQTSKEHDVRTNREIGKRPNVEVKQGDGRGFTGFFSNISLGYKGKPNAKPYEPTLNVEPISDFVREYNNHRGNFDDHIATSIPGFREVQTIVGSAIAKTYKNADMLDIGASEGALIKAVTKMSNGSVRTVALDPNFAMAKHFNDGEEVEGSVYDTSAFGTKADEGQLAWNEDETLTDRDGQVTSNPFAGEEVRWFKPDRQFDVIHEAMVFQFISGNRASQIARAKELMKPDGVLIIEEKFVAGDQLSSEQFRANETQKDAYKEQYFTKAEIAAKAKAVGVAEKAAFQEIQEKKEQQVTGMNDLMVSPGAIEDVLGSNFDHVAQFWDSGNFKGYIASDSPEAVERLINNMLSTDSKFANVKTPRAVKYSPVPSDDGIVLGRLQPDAVEFPGVHYGNVQTDELQGSKYGTGLRGAERRRLQNTDDERIKNRVYFYINKPDGTMPIPEAGVGNHVYTQKFKNILGPGKKMTEISKEAGGDFNYFEAGIVDAGYDGYAVPEMGMMVILNHNVPVNYRGTRAEISESGTKLSLRTYFPTAEEAEAAAYQKAPPGTAAFKRFFGASRVMEEGRPQVMYHASPNEFNTFRENKPIFVSSNPKWAEDYVIARGFDADELKVYPLWVRAETPFDYENPDHVAMIRQAMIDSPDIGKDFAMSEERLSSGDWSAIEDPFVLKEIKKRGFDSFYVSEGGAKNLAVFNANQVKSITGNIGDFSLETKDMRYSLKKVRYSDDRFEKLWDQSFYTQNGAENKTKGYLAFVNPMDFVLATASPETLERLRKEQEPLDFEKMKNYGQVPYLSVSEKDGNWKITGHEGRHRLLALHDAGYREVPVYIDLRTDNAESIPVKMLTAQFTESVSPFLMAVEVEPLSYANKQKAKEKFTRMESKVKYSLPSVSAGADNRVNATTTVRENDGFVGRMLKAISPESRSYFRQQAINRYNQLSVIDKMRAEKMGGHVLMADQSAESAALMSDLGAGITASAMGFGNRMGGIPVYKNGVTTVINTGDQKGLIASLAPLAKYNDPKVYQYYQYWAAVKRGERLYAEGREQLIQPGDRKYADELLQKFPEFEQVQKDFNKFNEGLVQYMVDTGVLSEAQGREYVKHADYVPFYRQLNEEKTIGPNIFQSISGVKQPRKLKGGEAPLADFLETVVRNTQASIQAGIKNAAAQRAVNAAMDVGTDIGAERLNEVSSAPDTVTVLEKGKKVSYRVADPLFINAVKSLNIPELPFMTLLSAPSNTLRNLVTKDPGFMMANLMRDSLSAWVTSGQDIKPIIGTVQNFAKALAGKSPGMESLLNAGVVGGYEFSNVVEASAEQLAKDMQRKYGSSTATDKVLRPFTWVWEALEKGTEASDAATRIAVYERVMEETGNEAEALYRALEVMNFNRKGSSAVVRILTAAVPFLNARIQGLDVFYRASFGQMATKDAKAIQKAFWVRGMTLMALSSMYFFAVSDDEEYKKQEAETKDNYWIIPGVGKFPTPFEVGVLFKTIPERILAYSFKDDTGQDLKKSIQRALLNTFAFNPIPQAVKPLVEATTNYSFFTMRPIVGQGMEKVAPEFQVGPSTSKLAEMIGSQLGLSPIKIDAIIQGYTGTIGMYGVQAIDAVLNANSDSPNASKRFEQLPIIKRFALDPEARGNITQYYELKNAVDSLTATSSLLEKSMKPDEWADYMRENKGLFATTEYVRDLEKEMKELREMRRLVQSGPFSGDSKRDYLTTIGQAENNLTKNIQTVKKLIASYQ